MTFKKKTAFGATSRSARAGIYACGGLPPFNKDPEAFYSRQLGRMSDYDGKYTIESLD